MDGELLQFPCRQGWEHINLTGDYAVRRQSRRLEDGKFWPYGCPEKRTIFEGTIFSEFCGPEGQTLF